MLARSDSGAIGLPNSGTPRKSCGVGLSIGHASEPFEASIQLAEDAERAGLDFISVGDGDAGADRLLLRHSPALARGDREAAAAAVSDRLVDSIGVAGPATWQAARRACSPLLGGARAAARPPKSGAIGFIEGGN